MKKYSGTFWTNNSVVVLVTNLFFVHQFKIMMLLLHDSNVCERKFKYILYISSAKATSVVVVMGACLFRRVNSYARQVLWIDLLFEIAKCFNLFALLGNGEAGIQVELLSAKTTTPTRLVYLRFEGYLCVDTQECPSRWSHSQTYEL